MSIIHVLGESAVRSLALALSVAIVLRVLRVQHARLAKRAWTAVLILALAMPALVALHIPSFSFTALWSAPRTIIRPAATIFPIAIDSSLGTAPARHLPLWQIGFGAYLAITALLLLRVLLGLALAVRLWRRAQPFATSEA